MNQKKQSHVCADNEKITAQELEFLIKLIGTGDREALKTLYESTSTAIYGFSFSICKNAEIAEDVMQDVFLKIIASAAEYQPRQKPMAWILTITRNLSLSRYRANQKKADLPPEEYELVSAENISDQVSDKMILNQAFHILGEEERQIVMLFAVTGLKHREIAALLDIPLATVLSKYRRALQKLRKQIEGETKGGHSNEKKRTVASDCK